MRPRQTYLKFHFIVFGLLSAIAQIPIAVLFAAMFTLGLGFVLLAASATILLSRTVQPNTSLKSDSAFKADAKPLYGPV